MMYRVVKLVVGIFIKKTKNLSSLFPGVLMYYWIMVKKRKYLL